MDHYNLLFKEWRGQLLCPDLAVKKLILYIQIHNLKSKQDQQPVWQKERADRKIGLLLIPRVNN